LDYVSIAVVSLLVIPQIYAIATFVMTASELPSPLMKKLAQLVAEV
jgi:hypothetical protein